MEENEAKDDTLNKSIRRLFEKKKLLGNSVVKMLTINVNKLTIYKK